MLDKVFFLLKYIMELGIFVVENVIKELVFCKRFGGYLLILFVLMENNGLLSWDILVVRKELYCKLG